jgi:hypothetical protein
MEYNLFKTHIIEMKQTLEKVNVPTTSKRQQVKELENLIEPKDLEMINFVNCMHDMIWVMEKQEAQWVEKVEFTHMRKFDWTYINLLVITELICNF